MKSRHCCNCCSAMSCSAAAGPAAKGHHVPLPQWECWLHTNHTGAWECSAWLRPPLASEHMSEPSLPACPGSDSLLCHRAAHPESLLNSALPQLIGWDYCTQSQWQWGSRWKVNFNHRTKPATPYCRLLALLSICRNSYFPLMSLILTFSSFIPQFNSQSITVIKNAKENKIFHGYKSTCRFFYGSFH